jgi:hypothetical protein
LPVHTPERIAAKITKHTKTNNRVALTIHETTRLLGLFVAFVLFVAVW